MLSAGQRVCTYGETDYHTNAPNGATTGAWIYASQTSQANVIDAVKQGRTYASDSRDLSVDFKVNGYPMGSDLTSVVGDVSLTLNVSAAVAGGTVDRVTVIRDNAQIYTATPPAAPSFDPARIPVTGRRTY